MENYSDSEKPFNNWNKTNDYNTLEEQTIILNVD